MADDEIMIEDDAIALEDTEDTVAEDVDVSNIIPFIMERYQRAEDYREQDEQRWLRAYRNYRGLYGPDVQFTVHQCVKHSSAQRQATPMPHARSVGTYKQCKTVASRSTKT